MAPVVEWAALSLKVAFLVQDLQLSGGVGVLVEHAWRLRRHHDVDVRLVLTRPESHPAWGYRGLEDVPVLELDEGLAERWDIALASWWETTSVLFRFDAARHACLTQALEDSIYDHRQPERIAASLVATLPVRFVTEARWIAETLERLQPGNRVLYVRNGIAKDVFGPVDAIAPAAEDEPLRIVVEGPLDKPKKGVRDALHAVSLMREPAELTWIAPHPVDDPPPGVDRVCSRLSHAEMAAELGRQHVMLKLSRNEGMYGPPLEAFHRGATVVTSAVSGHDEFVVHRDNALVVGWDDPHGTARALDLLARDRVLLHRLRLGALETARAWPDWSRAASLMACALRRIAAEPMPPARASGLRAASEMSTVQGELEYLRWSFETQLAMREALRNERAYQYAMRVRKAVDRARSVRRRLRRPAR